MHLKQNDWQKYYYIHENSTVQSYIYDPDNLDINPSPYWDTYEEAEAAIEKNNQYCIECGEKVDPKYESILNIHEIFLI